MPQQYLQQYGEQEKKQGTQLVTLEDFSFELHQLCPNKVTTGYYGERNPPKWHQKNYNYSSNEVDDFFFLGTIIFFKSGDLAADLSTRKDLIQILTNSKYIVTRCSILLKYQFIFVVAVITFRIVSCKNCKLLKIKPLKKFKFYTGL